MKDPGVLVIGAGGHAKVVIATLEAAGRVVRAAVDDDAKRHGARILGVPVIGPLDAAMDYQGLEAIVAIGNNETRRAIAERLPLRWTTAVHPRAEVHSSARLGPGTVVFAGAVVQPDARIGSHVILNTAATVDHDCSVGDFAHLAPGTHLSGNVSVGHGVFLGVGAAVLPNLVLGDTAIVGGGAVVVRNVAEDMVVAGVPARPLRPASGGTRRAGRRQYIRAPLVVRS
jgi:sugar O-acyltransferase (sialic acid O-acetyltransferase NeuD family)